MVISGSIMRTFYSIFLIFFPQFSITNVHLTPGFCGRRSSLKNWRILGWTPYQSAKRDGRKQKVVPNCYSWFGPPVHARETPIYQRTRRAATNPRPHSKSSRQGGFRSVVTIFVELIFTQNNFQNNAKIKI